MVKQPWMVPLFHTFTYGGIYMEKKTENIRISLTDSIILMLVIIAEIVFCVRGGLNLAVPLLLTWLIIFLYCKIRKLPWDVVEGYALQGVRDGFQSVCIVAAVGCLIGTWILGGTIPTMIYYGLKLINPNIFLPCTLILCSILSVFTGTSYGSAASAGLACMGIGLSWDFLRDWLPVQLSPVLFSVIRCPRSLILQTLHLRWQAAHFSGISVPCAIPLFRAG